MAEEIEEFHYSKDRDERVKDTGEVFTPPELINKMLDDIGYDWINHDHTKKWLDPTGGSGNFLVELAKRGILLENMYSVDLMPDNVEMMHSRLKKIFGDTEDTAFHLNRNVVQGDALTYHFDFYEYIPPAEIQEDEW